MEQPRQRRQRADAGVIRQTARDAAVLEWLSQMYGAPLDVIARGLGVSDGRAWALADRWRRAGWVEVQKVDAGPMWVWPVRSTAGEYLGWDPGHWRPRQTTTGHLRAVAEVRLWAQGGRITPDGWTSERHMRHEVARGRLRQQGDQFPHLPDGIVHHPERGTFVIEVELTPKSIERTYQALLEATGGRFGTANVGGRGVLYVVSATAKGVVERARSQIETPERVQIFAIEDIRAKTG